MKFILMILTHHIFIYSTGGSEKLIKSVKLFTKFNDIDNNNRFLYNTTGQGIEKYLNYKDVYGLRYSPSENPIKKHSNEDELLSLQSTAPNMNDNETKTTNEELLSSSVESEILVQSESNVVTSSQNFENANSFTFEQIEEFTDESKNHIMRPNHRVEYALGFLAEKLKKLIKFSKDKSQPESELTPHLTTLGRFLNLFTLIQFENIPCLTAKKPLRQFSGTCYSEANCLNLGGIIIDRCANDFGVCCVFKGGCNSVTQQNVTYFESPNFPLGSRANLGTCTLTLLVARNVKQVLVEFLFFELLPPIDGNCLEDRFVVLGQATNNIIPEICGLATGQHIFIDVEDSERILFNVLTQTKADRAFSIKITQLKNNLAPQGCLQYHTNKNGIIKSFNYDDHSRIQLLRRPSYFNNLNYSICIKRAVGHCKIIYTNELKGKEDLFELRNLDENGNILSGEGNAGAEIFSCNDDYIAMNFIRLCGSKFNDGSVSGNFNENAPVQSIINGPIVIPFRTDKSAVARGFKLFYFQDRCSK